MTPNPLRPRLATLLATVALLLAPAAAVHAAAEPATTVKTRELSPGLHQMLERKAELGLTADQESRLKQIRKDLAEKNRPLLEQVEAVIGEDYVMARAAEGKSLPELQPVYRQIRENRKAAWQQAKTVLNPDQQAKVEQWAKEKQKEMKEKGKSQGKGKSKGAASSTGAPPESKEAVEQGASGR